MNRKTRAFNAIFFKELRDAYHYPLAVVGVLLLLAGPFFAPWHYVPEPTLGNLLPTIKEAAELLAGQYAGHWGRYALFSVFILATLLPAGMFARERKTKEIACSQRFPVSLQTVFLAKFSAVFVLIALVAVGFVLTGFCFDLSYGMTPFSALTEFTRRYDPHEFSHCKAFALSPFELLIWSAFWATLIRREAFVVTASLLSTFAVWAVVGWVATSVGDTPTSLTSTATWRPPRDLSVVTVGGVASVGSPFYAALRFGALLLPLVGIVRVFRRDGAQTTLCNGLTGLDFRFKTFLTKRRRFNATATSASVRVDSNASAEHCERSTSVSSRLVDLTPRRLRPLTALCVETVESASLFGRFRGAVAIDLLIFNLLFLNAATGVAPFGVILVWFLFVVLFGTGAFAGLRRERSILTTRLPVSPSVYYASQLLAYTTLYVAACLPAICFQHLCPEAANFLRNLFTANHLELDASHRQTQGFLFFGAYHWFVVFCASAIGRTRLGAALLSVLFYIAVLCVKFALYGLADGTPPEAAYTLVYLPALVVGIASYPSASRRFRRSQ